MGSGVSLAPSLCRSDCEVPEDVTCIYPERKEELVQNRVFTSSLINQNPEDVEREFDWPDVNFIVDIITNPETLTRYRTPSEALYNVIFPLFIGKDATKPYIHQLLFQYFEFAKKQYSEYHKLHKTRCANDSKLRREHHKMHKELHQSNSDSKLSSLLESFANNTPLQLATLQPLAGVAFAPVIDNKTRIMDLMDFPTKNATIASNGRYVYVSESRGYISVYLRGTRLQSVRISRHDIAFAASNDFIYVTDFEKEYICSDYPLQVVSGSSRISVPWPFCSDGSIIYSLTRSKIVTSAIDERGIIKHMQAVDWKSIEKNPDIVYCSGAIITLVKQDNDKYTLRHYSTENGQHIGDFDFISQIPINGISFDPFNHCFFAVSVFQHSTKMLQFPYYGALPKWITGINIKNVPTYDPHASSPTDLLKFIVAHASGMSLGAHTEPNSLIEEMLSPPSHEFLRSAIRLLKDDKLAMIILAILQMRIPNHRIDSEMATAIKSLEMTQPVLFIMMNSYKALFREVLDGGHHVFELILKESELFKLFIIKNNQKVLPFCFSPELCRSVFSCIFDKLTTGKATSRFELELVDAFQQQIMKRKRYKRSKNTFMSYANVVFDAYVMIQRKGEHIPRQAMMVFQQFLFLLKPILKYSSAAVELYPRLFELLYESTRNTPRLQLLSDQCLTTFRLLFLCTSCIETIMKGGKEMQMPFVNEIQMQVELETRDNIAHLVADNETEVANLYNTVLTTAVKRLGLRMTPLEKRFERIITAVAIKQHGAVDDFRRYLNTGETTERLQEVIRICGTIRQKVRNLAQSCGCQREFENELIRKAEFLLRVQVTNDFRISRFLASEYSLHGIIAILEDAEAARENVARAYTAIEQLIDMNHSYGTFAITYLLKMRFWGKLLASPHAYASRVSLMRKIHDFSANSIPVFVFYCILVTSFIKMDAFLSVLNDITTREIPRPLKILILSVLYMKKHDAEETTKADVPKTNEIRDILFEKADKFTYDDVPMLRLALKSRLEIPLSFIQLMDIFKTSKETYMHGIVELIGDVIEKSNDQRHIFEWILTEIGVIASGKQGFFSGFPEHLQLSICDQLIELVRKFVTREPCHGIFVSVLSEGMNRTHIFAIFAILSASFDTFHSHFLMRDTRKNTTNYIINITSGGTIRYYPLPFDPYSAPKEEKNVKQIQPISEIEFSVKLFPERDLLIPYYVRALRDECVDVLNYYILQSLKEYIDNSEFLEQFLNSQNAISLEKFSFVDFSRHFLRVLEFGFKHTVIPTGEDFFALCDDSESLTITSSELKSTTGKRFIYSPILNNDNTITLELLEVSGNVTFGIQSLSLFNYSTSRYVYDTKSRHVTYNDTIVTTLESVNTLRFDSKSSEISFGDLVIRAGNESFCFIVILEGDSFVRYNVTGVFGSSHRFYKRVPYFTLRDDCSHGRLFSYPEELRSGHLNLNLVFQPTECPCVQATRTINSLFTDIIKPAKTTSEIQLFYISQILGSIQCEINSRILMKSIQNDSYTMSKFVLNNVQLLNFAMSLLTLTEPMTLDTPMLNFAFDIFTARPPDLEFECVEKIINLIGADESTRIWFSILKDKMNTTKYHFSDTENPNVIVMTPESVKQGQRIEMPRANGFIVMKSCFSHRVRNLATVNGKMELSSNLLCVTGTVLEVKGEPSMPILCIPVYSKHNTSLLVSFFELAVTFKYFVLRLRKCKDQMSHEDYQRQKIRCYNLFFNSVNFESPFFYSYSDIIQDFLAENIPLTMHDLDEKMANMLSRLAAYSGHKSLIASFLRKMQILWNDKSLLPLASHFPEFSAEPVTPESNVIILPPSPFRNELSAEEDHSQLIVIIKALLIQKCVIGFPFHHIITMWCAAASQYPPFQWRKLDEHTITIEFDFFEPKQFEFHFNKRPFSLTRIENNKYRAHHTIPDDLKFYITNIDVVPAEDFVTQYRSAFVRDVTILVENWDRVYDHKILKRFPDKVLRGSKLKLPLSPEVFIQSRLNLPFHLLIIRGTILATLNWLFLKDTDSPSFNKLFEFISRDIRLDMFMNLVQKKSVPYRVVIRVDRLAALENRNGTRLQLSNSFVSQIASCYDDPARFRSQWKVMWVQELGEDGGGPGRELITEAATDIFSPNTGLFVEYNKDIYIPVCSDQLDNPSKLYKIVGVVLGMIIRNCVVQRFPVPPFFWRYMCTGNIHIGDIYEIDEAYRDEISGLLMLKEDDFNARFSDKKFTERDFKGNEVQMKEGVVTYERIHEFVSMSNQFRLSLIQSNLENIRNGLFENLGITSLPRFVTPDLLEFTVCGFPKISAKAMMKAVKFREVTSTVRQMFTRIVIELSSEQRSQLLKFVTGRIRLPKLEDGQTLFSVDMALGMEDKLPSASTCFCQLHLPKYSSFEIAKRQIITAIENTSSFENR